MYIFKCYDIISMVIDEAVIQNNTLQRKNMDMLKSASAIIDSLIQRFDGMSLSASIDETSNNLIVTFTCPSITIEDKNDEFYNLLNHVNRFSLEEIDDLIRLDFEFDSILSQNEIA